MMRVSIVLTTLLTFVSALPQLSIIKNTDRTANRAFLRKRAVGAEILNITNWDIIGKGYYVNVSVGTPPQEQTISFSTGSSDFYLVSSATDECQLTPGTPGSCYGGSFDSNESSSYTLISASPAFNITYADGSALTGPFGQDTVVIGDTSVPGVQIGVAENVTDFVGPLTGIMGLGYYTDEASIAHYPTIVDDMTENALIPSRLFSISLGHGDSNLGSLLFGGIDTTQYTGKLTTLNLLPDAENGEVSSTTISEFITTITDAEISINGRTEELWSGGSASTSAYDSSDPSIPVLLEYASVGMSLPQSVYDEAIAPHFPYVESDGTCSCTYRDTSDFLNLTFGQEAHITVAISDLFTPTWNTTLEEPIVYDNGTGICRFLIFSSSEKSTGDGLSIIGWGLLESIYAVFDMDNRQISIAQAAAKPADQPNIITIQAGPNRVSEAAASVPTSVASGPSTTTAPSHATNTSTSKSSGGSNTGAIAGGVVGGVIGIALIAGLAYFIIRRRRKSNMPATPMLQAESGPWKADERKWEKPMPVDSHSTANKLEDGALKKEGVRGPSELE